jgi:hypothetical protein
VVFKLIEKIVVRFEAKSKSALNIRFDLYYGQDVRTVGTEIGIRGWKVARLKSNTRNVGEKYIYIYTYM